MIHPTAIVHPEAELDPTVEVGPCAVIDARVVVGPRCVIGPHVLLTGHTRIGADNWFHAGAVIGDAPQDMKYADAPTRLRIGERNRFREHVTVHRSNRVVLANGALVAGHVVVQDRAFISGNCLVHQFVRVGTLALMQGGSAISKDLPPFTVARGANQICGLNTVGLRRAGFTAPERAVLRRLYRELFLSGGNLRFAAAAARSQFSAEPGHTLIEFVLASRRGVCTHAGSGVRKSRTPSEGAEGAGIPEGGEGD